MNERRADETQKEVRIMEVKVIGIERDAGGVQSITYSYIANPAKADTYEVRKPKEQEQVLDLTTLRPGKTYEVHCLNIGTEKRSAWIWYRATEVTQEHAMALFKIRQRKAPSRNVEIHRHVWKAAQHFGEVADDAYAIWKHNHNGQNPNYLELLWQLSKMRDKVNAEARQKAVALMREFADAFEKEMAVRDLLDFGDKKKDPKGK